MIAPRIHLNGDRKETLLDGIQTAYSKAQAALNGLQDMFPNARNYYVIGPHAYMQARQEHEDRMRRLQTIVDELLGMYEAIEQDEIAFEIKARR